MRNQTYVVSKKFPGYELFNGQETLTHSRQFQINFTFKYIF